MALIQISDEFWEELNRKRKKPSDTFEDMLKDMLSNYNNKDCGPANASGGVSDER